MKLITANLSHAVCCLRESSVPAGLLTEVILPVTCECDSIFVRAPAPPTPPISMLANSLPTPLCGVIGGINFASSDPRSHLQL